MQVKIDKFGRVVLPRSIRREVQVGAGSVLEIEVVGRGETVLSPARDEQPLLGRMVFSCTEAGRRLTWRRPGALPADGCF